MGYLRPVSIKYPISSPFGPRNIGGVASTNHLGTDLATPEGTAVVASESGVITHAGMLGGYGWLIRIYHGNGHETLYAHLSHIGVRVGQTVVKGQVIGASGGRLGHPGAGNTTGPHLHTEHRDNGVPIDPAPFWADTAALDAAPIEKEDEMRLIKAYGADDKGVVAPGFGYAFKDIGEAQHFLNLWELGPIEKAEFKTVGGATYTKEQNRQLFKSLIDIHRNGSAPANVAVKL